ncbi:MAG: type II secretion system F family protein, partial [Candidatus Lariskella arthropodorum]
MINQINRFFINIEFGVDKKVEYLEMLNEMLSYGMSLVQIYEKLFPKVFTKGVILKLNKKVIQALNEGKGIASCLLNYFPSSVVHLIEIGEQAGNLKEGVINAINALKWSKNSIHPALSSMLYPLMVVISSSVLFIYYKSILLQLLASFKGK